MADMRSTPFGELLRRARQAAGLTQAELAERAGLSVRGINDLERGARQTPRRDTVALLAQALDLTGATAMGERARPCASGWAHRTVPGGERTSSERQPLRG
jgi:transcriptional regulator with XRE-family HTH domain